jgi:hypothetical protein
MKLGLNGHFDDIEVFQIAHDCWPCHIAYAHQAHSFIHMNKDGEQYLIPFNVHSSSTNSFCAKSMACYQVAHSSTKEPKLAYGEGS